MYFSQIRLEISFVITLTTFLIVLSCNLIPNPLSAPSPTGEESVMITQHTVQQSELMNPLPAGKLSGNEFDHLFFCRGQSDRIILLIFDQNL